MFPYAETLAADSLSSTIFWKYAGIWIFLLLQDLTLVSPLYICVNTAFQGRQFSTEQRSCTCLRAKAMPQNEESFYSLWYKPVTDDFTGALQLFCSKELVQPLQHLVVVRSVAQPICWCLVSTVVMLLQVPFYTLVRRGMWLGWLGQHHYQDCSQIRTFCSEAHIGVKIKTTKPHWLPPIATKAEIQN